MSTEAKRRGRPPVLSPGTRRQHVFAALAEIVETDGVEGLTMDAIAAAAGMSKRTLYDLFDDRNALFCAYIDHISSDFIRPLGPDADGLPLGARLYRLLAPVIRDRHRGVPLVIMRIAISCGDAAETPIRAHLHRVRSLGRDLIRAELDRAVARGEATVADTEMAAELLQAMLYPDLVDKLIDPDRDTPLCGVQNRFDLGLRTFLRGIDAGDLTDCACTDPHVRAP